MEKPIKGTALYEALRIRDPIVRKQMMDNIIKQQKENKEITTPLISCMFAWDETPEGDEYWRKISMRYKRDATLWADQPILDDEPLPAEYCVKNPNPDGNEEMAKLLYMIDNRVKWNGNCSWYTIRRGAVDTGNIIGLPEIPYSQWKAAIEKQYSKQQPVERSIENVAVDDWVIGRSTNDHPHTAVQVTNRNIDQIYWDEKKYGKYDHPWTSYRNLRYATPAETEAAKKAQAPVKKEEPASEYSILTDYSVQALMGKKVAIHCPTQEEWDKVTEILKYTWRLDSKWAVYRDKACINANSNTHGAADVSYTKARGFQLIPASVFIAANEKKQPVQEYKKGDWVTVVKERIEGAPSTGNNGDWKIGETLQVQDTGKSGIDEVDTWIHHAVRKSISIHLVRPATAEEIAKVTSNQGVFNGGDWVECVPGYTGGSSSERMYGGAGYKAGRKIQVDRVSRYPNDKKGDVLWIRDDEDGYGVYSWAVKKTEAPAVPADTRKKLSFKTEDGYDLYKGDSPQWVVKLSTGWELNGVKCTVVEDHTETIATGNHKVFHSKKAAEKWVEEENMRLQMMKDQPVAPVVHQYSIGPVQKKYKVGDIVWAVNREDNGLEGYQENIESKCEIVPDNTQCTGMLLDKAKIQYVVKVISGGNRGCYMINEVDITRKEEPVAEPWSIVTTDGVKVYENEPLWWLDEEGKKHLSPKDGSGDPDRRGREINVKEGYIPFSTYDAAEAYRKKQCGETLKVQPVGWKPGDRWRHKDGEWGKSFDQIEGDNVFVDYGENGTNWVDIKSVNEYIKDGIWVLQPGTAPVQRKWKIGDRFVHQWAPEGTVYTIDCVHNSGKRVKITWCDKESRKTKEQHYDISELDRHTESGMWILINPKPVMVTAKNAYIGMKVVRGRDWAWGNNGNTTPDTVGVVKRVDSDEWVLIKWPTNENSLNYRVGYDNKYDLYIAPEEQVTITNNSQTNQKQQQNEKHNNSSEEIISKSNSYEGSSLIEWPQECTISKGYSYTGKSLSVHAEPDSISRGKRATGTALSCW